MTTTLEPRVADRAPAAAGAEAAPPRLAEGLELLGEVHGSGYKHDQSLVRRADGQMVQVGPLLYALLASVDGRRDDARLAGAICERLGRRVEAPHAARLREKAAGQGLLAGSEHNAPPKRNPLLALRWKVLVTNPVWTRRLTAPFTILFRPWLMWPIVAAFVAVCWFVLVEKGIASATAQAFHRPELLLAIFVLAVASAGFHELGHAAACRYGGGTPRGMGMGIYMVWPAFYTDVTDAYRLPRRDRLRVDLGGLYFNAVVAVATLAVWLAVRADALLLLIGLQLLQMVKQLSPVIRADGYHILADATGVPDLFAHIGPTLRRLIPGHGREPSALKGRARALVTLWVLIVVPVLLSLMVSAIVLLPRLATTAWDSGRAIAADIPHEGVLDVLASCVRLFALVLPVVGSALVAQRIARATADKALAWSDGRRGRRVAVHAAAAALAVLATWAWWPSGQYQPVRGNERGTVGGMVRLVAAPQAAARPAPRPQAVRLAPGTHLAVSLIPRGGATRRHPAFFLVQDKHGKPAAVLVSDTAPDPATAPTVSGQSPSPSAPPPVDATVAAFPFHLPSPPGPGDSQALAVNTKDGAIVYDVAYSLVTVHDGDPVTNTNSAFALANCRACMTVAVSVQIVLVVGQSHQIAPIDAAGALNGNCPVCITTAVADQIVVTLKAAPTQAVLDQLQQDLQQLDALPLLGANGTPDQIASRVAAVQQQIEDDLKASGLLADPAPSPTPTPQATATATATPTATASPSPTASPTATDTATPTPTPSTTATPTPTPTATTAPAAASATQTPAPTP